MITKIGMIGLAALGVFAVAPDAADAADLITNGSFETLTSGLGQIGYNTDATGWTTTGYNFVFGPGIADTTGVSGLNNNLQLWGPGNGSNNGLPATSPDGGNFIAADAVYRVGAITQTINGLTVGNTYEVGFHWAGAQQSGFTGTTTEQWKVKLGNDQRTTAVVNNANHGFTGWQHQTFSYVATAGSEVLSFLATGTPAGEPPFVLLDGVTMNDMSGTDVPEPTPVFAMFADIIGVGIFARRRARTKKPLA